MVRIRNVPFACAIALALLTACALPSPIAPAPGLAFSSPRAPWRYVDESTGRISDLAGVTALAADFPNSASVQRRLLSAALGEKDATVARSSLQRLEAMGYALSPAAFDALAPLIGEAEAKAAQARSETLRRPAASAVFATIPPEFRLIEGLAWDARRNRLYLSSVVDRRLLATGERGWTEVPGIDGGSLFGLAIDEPRRLLWIASGVVEQTPSPETAFRGLIALDLDSGRVVRRVASPVGPSHRPSLSDITVGADGTVYASDPTGGGVYLLRPGASAIETLIPPGVLRSPQGIAVRPSGKRLYISDYGYGIAVFDLLHHRIGRLAAASQMMLDGTDGLYWFEDGLVAIQNGTNPMRIERISLDEAGETATGLTLIESGHPDWGEPTNGQIVGEHLLYVSDPQWGRFGPGGAVKGDEPLRPNLIRIAPLTSAGSPPPG